MLKKIFSLFKERTQDESEYLNIILNLKGKTPYCFQDQYIGQEKTLHKMYGDANSINGHIKLLLISDTHSSLNEEKFKHYILEHSNYDACILLGDHSPRDIELILKYIPTDKIYALLGNHDNEYPRIYGLRDINGKVININGIKLLGIQGSFKYKPLGYPSFNQKESIEFLMEKEPVDILLSHANRFDENKMNNPGHQGLFGITYYLFKNKIPYHIHGHIHEAYHNTLINNTKEISVYMLEYLEI